MQLVADGVHLISWGLPPKFFNAFLVGDVLLDAGIRQARRWVLRELRGHHVSAHALTHVHPDHSGSSRRICEELGVPLWCGEGDADAMEAGASNYVPEGNFHRFLRRSLGGPGRPVERRLRHGDAVADGFTVIETPGHSPGHLSLWREADRTLLVGEVVVNFYGRLAEPGRVFTRDLALNRRSARRLAELNPVRVCFSHGLPLQEGRRFLDFVASLP